jgi:hypothetical protein
MCLLQGPTYPRRRVLKPLFKVLAAEARCQVVQRRGSDEVALRGSEGERVWHSYYGVPHICKSMARCPYAMHAHHSCCDTMPHLPATGSRATWPMAASPCWQCRSAIGGWGRLPACRSALPCAWCDLLHMGHKGKSRLGTVSTCMGAGMKWLQLERVRNTHRRGAGVHCRPGTPGGPPSRAQASEAARPC